ncbi:MAG: hypothetical protein Q9160_004610 [Pyrenula sp. 1 TL-2023]
MSARKLTQEIDKTFKKVAEGIEEFNAIHEKILSSTNAAQKEKQEDLLKREIKKLQRLRDTIKGWAAGNEVKDKAPLLEHRKRIEKCMEQFKAVEKEMKTKAFSKEGLSMSGKIDPREKEREELCDYLSDQLDEIQRILESLEAEEAILQVAVKKSKRDTTKANRLADIGTITDRFKWHEGKLELLRRSLQNDSVEAGQVHDIKGDIEFLISDGQVAEFEGENDALYDDFNLEAEEASFGLNNDNDKISSQDAQSVPGDVEQEQPKITKVKSEPIAATRRPSVQHKGPILPTATPAASTGTLPPLPKDTSMKPAPIPTRPAGETLKYASAAAAAAASDKAGVGIAPLPPPPNTNPTSAATPPPAPAPTKTSTATSPAPVPAQVAGKATPPVLSNNDASVTADQSKSPTLSQSSSTNAAVTSGQSSVPATPALENAEDIANPIIANVSTNGDALERGESEESVYHLPSGLEDLIQSVETTKARKTSNISSPSFQRLLAASRENAPEPSDADRPRHYKPNFRYSTPGWYPQVPLSQFDDPRMYENGKIEPDTLFYTFYYRQGTYQQYLAAKALKSQSWRFHKQYQTWFQRHEEPKTITEEYEQGTYRFFDYESTW